MPVRTKEDSKGCFIPEVLRDVVTNIHEEVALVEDQVHLPWKQQEQKEWREVGAFRH